MAGRMSAIVLVLSVCVAAETWRPVGARDAGYPSAEPQPSGWPLTPTEREYVLKPEHARRPGSEAQKYLPQLWPVVPSAGFWTGTAWLDTHARLVAHARRNQGRVDFLLVGDSITQQWGSPLDGQPPRAAWTGRFGQARTINIGIGGDKTQNVLWRLNHGAVDGLAPRCIVLMIGNNNMYFVPETGVEAAARGIKACVDALRRRFPETPLIVVKILPAHAPGHPFHEHIRETNSALDLLKLEADRRVRVLDLTRDMTNADGTLRTALYSADHVHLSEAGYGAYAARLQPEVEALLGRASQ